MSVDNFLNQFSWFIDGEVPVLNRRMFGSSPTKRALVGTTNTGGAFDTLVTGNVVEAVFVATALSADHGFCPAANFDG